MGGLGGGAPRVTAVHYVLEESSGYMEPALRILAVLHTAISFCCIIGYYCLKVSAGPGAGRRCASPACAPDRCGRSRDGSRVHGFIRDRPRNRHRRARGGRRTQRRQKWGPAPTPGTRRPAARLHAEALRCRPVALFHR